MAAREISITEFQKLKQLMTTRVTTAAIVPMTTSIAPTTTSAAMVPMTTSIAPTTTTVLGEINSYLFFTSINLSILIFFTMFIIIICFYFIKKGIITIEIMLLTTN